MDSLTDEALVAALSDSPWERLQAAQPARTSRHLDPLRPPRWRLVVDRAIARLELLVWLLETDVRSFDEEIDAALARLCEPRLA